MDLGLTGRTALVGGASSGLGRASADALAAAGCRLVIWSRGRPGLELAAAELRDTHGVEVVILEGDAGEPGTGERIASAAQAALGTIDIVVLNAGGPPTVDPTATDAAAWQQAFQLLSITPIELATALMPGMRTRGWGRVVGILSSGVRQPIADLVYSNAARGALAAWLKTTARAVAADGVTVNGVLPGRLQTPRIDSLDRGRSERTGESLEAVRAAHLAAIPAGRYGRPEELGAYVAYLCSEQSGYQTGTFTAIDGGLVAGLP
jgi:3-oxoacyl-[acyl-carrier protein] reductase